MTPTELLVRQRETVLPSYISRDWLDRRHPLSYGEGSDRMARCPECQEWSPCRVRTLYEHAARNDRALLLNVTDTGVSVLAEWDRVMRRLAEQGESTATAADFATLADTVLPFRQALDALFAAWRAER